MRLQGEDIYLDTLEREHCRRLWQEFEYDFACPAEPLNPGFSVEKADEWFADIQRDQGGRHIRLGIFLNDGTVIGDAALQDLSVEHRSCTVGMGFSRLEYRGRGYGSQALRLMLKLGFEHRGLERISASTLELNIPAQKSLEKNGFVLEGRERKAVYLNGRRYDRLLYAMLAEEYFAAQ